jgi:hypothetical protein
MFGWIKRFLQSLFGRKSQTLGEELEYDNSQVGCPGSSPEVPVPSYRSLIPGYQYKYKAPEEPAIAKAMRLSMGDHTALELRQGKPAGKPQRISFNEAGEPAVSENADLCSADVCIETINNPDAVVPDLSMLGGPAVEDPTFAPLYEKLFGKKPTGVHTRRRIL